MADIQEDRRRKVEDLMRRQKRHAAKRRKEQVREAKRFGKTSSSGQFSDDERKMKVRQLKDWLKKREEKEPQQQQMSPMDKLMQLAAKAPGDLDKLEQTNADFRNRRANVQEKRREAIAQSMAALSGQKQDRVLHRHVHHHVHYHDGADSGEDIDGTPFTPPSGGLRHTASAGFIPSAASTNSMPWRPLVHSASAGPMPGYAPTMPGSMPMQVDHLGGFDRSDSHRPHSGGNWPGQAFKGSTAPPGQRVPSMPPLGARAGVR